MEIFTISGPPADGVELLGETPSAMFQRLQAARGGGPFVPGPKDTVCAQEVKGTFIAGTVSTVGAIPLGLFGVYKTIREGNRAAGVVALLGTVGAWFIGRAFLKNAANRFERCRRA